MEKPSGKAFSVATYNVKRYDMDERRMLLILDQVQRLAPTIIGFQEYPASLTEHMDEVLSVKQYGRYLGNRYEDLLHHPIYWNNELFEEVPGTACTQYLGPLIQFPCLSPGAITVRMSSSVILQRKGGNQRLLVINTQLDNVSFEARAAAVKQILRYVSCWPKDLPVVLVGDMNYSTSGPLLTRQMMKPHRRILNAGFIDCWERSNTAPQEMMFHGDKGSQAPIDPYATYSPDHEYVRRLLVSSCEVAHEPDDALSSDHYAMIAEVRFIT